jgi:hypothetical protein
MRRSWIRNRAGAVLLALTPLMTGVAVAAAQEKKPAPEPVPVEATKEAPKGPNTGRVSLSAGVDFPSDYYFRGIFQEDNDYIIQPYGDITFKLYEGSGAFTNLALTLGTWNSLHGGPTGIRGGSTSQDPKIWYESDFYTKVGATFFEDLTAQIIYTAYMSPNDRFRTVQELALALAWNDSKLLGAFALNPSALIAFEVQGQADGGRAKGVYLQFGTTPGYTFNAKGTYPIALTFPMVVGLSLDEYYEFGTGKDETFGYFQMGPAVSVPLAFIPAAFGAWQFKASVYWLTLGDNLKTVNRGDRNEIIGTFGISLTY